MQNHIVFLPIGDKKCGDAIAIRFGDVDSGDPNKQYVIVIDGGYTDDWQKIVDLVKINFGLPMIDLVVSSHTDKDHIGGLPGLIQNFRVANLWMHLPWNHSVDINTFKQSNYQNPKRLMTEWLKKSLKQSGELASVAIAAGITPEEPFTGMVYQTPYGKLTVLSPSLEYYETLLPMILDKSALKAAEQMSPYYQLQEYLSKSTKTDDDVEETHITETLTDNGDTSPSNNSSTVMLLELLTGQKYLFTADAGMAGLEFAYAEYIAQGHQTGQLSLIQIPHHGSRMNIGPTILDKFLGSPTAIPGLINGVAYVSVGETCDDDGHPKKVVTNAFKRRGYPVYQTRGTAIKHGHPLTGFGATIEPLPHFNKVEKDD